MNILPVVGKRQKRYEIEERLTYSLTQLMSHCSVVTDFIRQQSVLDFPLVLTLARRGGC